MGVSLTQSLNARPSPPNQTQSHAEVFAARLTLTDFRSYARLRVEFDDRPVVLSGPNGAGKTNLLEAISCLGPGRGMRRAGLKEISRHGGGKGWAVAARLSIAGSNRDVGVGFTADGDSERRQLRLDGDKATAGDLRGVIGLQWLTPRMDRLFVEGRSERRRFLDRLVFGSDPDHGRRIKAYENTMRERSRLLRERRRDETWLGALEARMAEDGTAIAAARIAQSERLSAALARGIGPFPRAELAVQGSVESSLALMPALEAEGRFADLLKANRSVDEAAGRAGDGPHLSDLLVTYTANGRAAADCSTGEQKALLIAVILANARLEAVERGQAPLLLLDEITAHLDSNRRGALFDEICALKGQTWMSGTDRLLFQALGKRAQFFTVHDSTLEAEE